MSHNANLNNIIGKRSHYINSNIIEKPHFYR